MKTILSSQIKQNDKRLFFNSSISENCHNLEYFIDCLEKHEQIVLNLAKRESKTDYFYCWHFQVVGEKEQGTCSKSCEAYQPLNGKKGICKHNGYCYEETNEKYLLKIDN